MFQLKSLRLLTLFSLISLPSLLFGQNNSIVLNVPFAPIPVAIFGDKTAIVYELTITNNTGEIITPVFIDILNSSNNNKLFVRYKGIKLKNNVDFPMNNNDDDDDTVDQCHDIKSGEQATLFVWLAIPNSQDLPSRFSHQMSYFVNNNNGAIQTTPVFGTVQVQQPNQIVQPSTQVQPPTGRNLTPPLTAIQTTPIRATVKVQAPTAISLTPPLNAGPWLVKGISNYTEDRRLKFSFQNQGPFIPGRFATSWVLYNNITPDGSNHSGTGNLNTDYFGYGQPVFASSSGTVVAIRNTFNDNPHPPIPQIFTNIFNNAGNFVVIRANNNNFLIYSHLQTFIFVANGQQVIAGQQLGLIGSSGDAAIPHLDFTVVNSTNAFSPFLAEGVPYTYKNFSLLSFSQADASFYLNPFTPILSDPISISNQIPLNGMFIQFPRILPLQ